VVDFVGAFIMLAIASGVWRSAAQRRAWSSAVARMPACRGADLVEGRQVKLVGVVEAAQTIAAPLTGRPCVGWTIRAVVAAGGAVHAGVRRSGACDFVVRDDEGVRVPVRGVRAALCVANGEPISAAREDGVVQRESLLRPGDRVAIVGLVRRELDPGGVAMYRDAPTRLVLDGIPLWILPAK
jgi:hypothetical protein